MRFRNELDVPLPADGGEQFGQRGLCERVKVALGFFDHDDVAWLRMQGSDNHWQRLRYANPHILQVRGGTIL